MASDMYVTEMLAMDWKEKWYDSFSTWIFKFNTT
jgi:hypothetical protein